MRVAVFSSRAYDRRFLNEANEVAGQPHVLEHYEARLTEQTARLAEEHEGVCAFVNDVLHRPVLVELKSAGCRGIALRCAGYNHVDLDAAEALGLPVMRVPAYSPQGIAEHAVGLMLALNRQVHRAYARVREGNFSLEGLLGFELGRRTVGIVGTGKIGLAVARILRGFGCELLAYDVSPSDEMRGLGARYVPLDRLLRDSDIVTLHCPLVPQTHHLINAQTLSTMRDGVMLINTSRGGLVYAPAVIEALKHGKLGYLGLDVYEEEAGVFFEDRSNTFIPDDVLARLLTFPNVIITSHQAFFTRHAMEQIAETTITNLSDLASGRTNGNQVHPSKDKAPGARDR